TECAGGRADATPFRAAARDRAAGKSFSQVVVRNLPGEKRLGNGGITGFQALGNKGERRYGSATADHSDHSVAERIARVALLTDLGLPPRFRRWRAAAHPAGPVADGRYPFAHVLTPTADGPSPWTGAAASQLPTELHR